MTTTTETITVDQFIPRLPERVWAAITTPDELAKWWVPGDIAAVVGHRFVLEMPGWGDVPCEVLEVVEHERLVHTFADCHHASFCSADVNENPDICRTEPVSG